VVIALRDSERRLPEEAAGSVDSSFTNHLRRLFIVTHSDEGAMPQVPGIRPFDESDLAYQLRFDPSALIHFFCG
jgi:hypothetical protein